MSIKIVIAPDSFKECLSASEVALTLADAIKEDVKEAQIVQLPLADGGEGTLDVLSGALGGTIYFAEVSDPLGRPVSAKYAVANNTAIIEVAQAVGLNLLQPSERNPLITTTRGVGELLMAARAKGCTNFIVGLGGSSTCDGGAGILSVPDICTALSNCTFTILCDVDNPFIGPLGAARVFAPQKGASPEDVEVLEKRLTEIAAKALEQTGIDIATLPGAGAAGGLGGAFMAYFKAQKVSGVDKVLELVKFKEHIAEADLVITGEGKSDAQTLMGKLPYGVLKRSGGIPVALLSGRIEDAKALKDAGFKYTIEVSPRHLPIQQALNPATAKANLALAARKLVRSFSE